MSKAIELKSAVVAEIAEKLEKAASVIVVDYKGLTVEQVTDLRSQMREAGVDYKVYKNTLVRRAASQIEGEAFANFNDELLVGPNAIAFGYEDAVAPARVLKAFMDKNPNKITLKMGVVEGEFYDEANRGLESGAYLKEISEMPVREKIARAKYMPESDLDKMNDILNEIENEVDNLINKGGSLDA